MFVEAKLFHKANESGGGGGGAVDSVNGKTGVVVLDGEDIEATVGSTEDTIQNHLQSLRTDLGDLAEDVAEKTEKVEITLTGESGTLTAEQISALTNADNVVSIVCDGQPFYLSNKDSTLTYRTYINTDCAVNSDVEFKAIYVQLNSEAANYGAWTLEEVSTGGGGLPDPTGHSGEFLTTDGTGASWSNKPLVNASTGVLSLSVGGNGTTQKMATNVGSGATNNGAQSVAVGTNSVAGLQGVSVGMATSANTGGIAIGFSIQAGSDAVAIRGAATASNAIQIGRGTNADAGTFKVGLGANKNYEILSADGTIPTARLTKVNDTITLTAAGWSGGSQTVTVTGMTATGVVLISPDPADQSAYTSAGILCTAQATDSLTFTATTTPTADIDVVVVML